MKKTTIGKFYRSLGEMLGSGVTFTKALETIKEDERFEELCSFADYILVSVSMGKSLIECFETAGFPSDHIEILRTSEKNGDLDRQLPKLADMVKKGKSFNINLPETDITPEQQAIELINQWFFFGVTNNASDLHIIPGIRDINVRFRIDGVLKSHAKLDKTLLPLISARLKTMSKLDVMEKRLPQDGRILIRVSERECDIRLSVVPSVVGEKWTARFLMKDNIVIDLKRLGLREDQSEILNRLMEKPHGLILVTGQTGSGKTTTCYSMLKEYVDRDLNVATVESPVEYLIEGATQVQTDTSIGLTFPATIRSLMRSDPDVIFIGEIRDHESIDLGIKAAQTGHVTVSQFHSKTALELLTLLSGFEDLDHPILATTLNGIISQVLLRKLCDCKKKVKAPGRFGKRYDIKNVYEPVGCEKCLNSGYRGRWAAYEIIEADLVLKEAIASRNIDQIREALNAHEMKGNSLLNSALMMLKEGITSMNEIYRIFGSL